MLILFWNPHGSDDMAVAQRDSPPSSVTLGSEGRRPLRERRRQVGEFGTITHAVQVNQTPTLLIVNPHGQTTHARPASPTPSRSSRPSREAAANVLRLTLDE